MAYPKIGSEIKFKDNFSSTSSVSQNGGTLTNATVSDGIMTCSTGGADYDVPNYNDFFINGGTVRMRIRTDSVSGSFLRFFTYNTGSPDIIGVTCGLNPSTGQIIMQVENPANIYLGVTPTLGVGFFTTIRELVMTYDPDTTTLSFYVDGALNAQDFNVSGTPSITPGASNDLIRLGRSSGSQFDGEIHLCEIYQEVWTADEVADAFNNSTYSELSKKPLVDLPLTTNYNDGADQVTKNVGSINGSATLGDGSTSSTFPDQLTPHGMEFDGTDDYLDVGALTQVEGVSNMTMSCWVKLFGFTDFDGIMVKGTATNDRFFLGLSGAGFNGNQALLLVMSNSGNAFGVTSSDLLQPERLYHLTYVYDGDGSTDEEKLKLYVNGEEITLSYTGTLPSTTPTNGLSFLCGNDAASGGRFMDGEIFFPKIYLESLTSRQIKHLYEQEQRLINL